MHPLPAVAIAVLDTGRALREAFFMFWQTLWALVLGFALSGVVQAFVTRSEMERMLGDHRPLTIIRAAGMGTASSSCSYAASAMARGLFARGADFLSSIVFMAASTNLVIELGVVLLALIGWPFLAAELIGAPIMIAVIALAGVVVVPSGLVVLARSRLQTANAVTLSAGSTGGAVQSEGALSSRWIERLADVHRWQDAAAYALSELRMVRRELVAGYLVAGGLAVLVPVAVWHAAFVQGHGIWSDLENAAIGPAVAFASCVCSIGNVPLAAALWHGGVAFGGVVSFVFGDLLAAPLVLIYRRYYGGPVTARLVMLLWGSMVVAALAVQGLFSWAGLIPARHSAQIVPLSLRLGPTTVFDVLALVVLAGIWTMTRRRPRQWAAEACQAHPSP